MGHREAFLKNREMVKLLEAASRDLERDQEQAPSHECLARVFALQLGEPRGAFRERLRAQVIAASAAQQPAPDAEQRAPTAGGKRFRSGARPRLATALAGVILALTITFPAIARTLLQFIMPQEVPVRTMAHEVRYLHDHVTLTELSASQIEEQTGFAVLVPTYLPDGCELREIRLFPKIPVVYLNTSCVTISQQLGVRSDKFAVGQKSVEHLTIAGKPAIYIDGEWGHIPASNEGSPQAWQVESQVRHLIFEDSNRIIRLKTTLLGKEELVQIAESLR